jgi:hypothetical protein
MLTKQEPTDTCHKVNIPRDRITTFQALVASRSDPGARLMGSDGNSSFGASITPYWLVSRVRASPTLTRREPRTVRVNIISKGRRSSGRLDAQTWLKLII